jgi:UPF0271 protein
MARSAALNADAGEGSPRDAALMPWLDRVSVACGGHAGGAATMRRTVRLARRHAVAVGAHVSYPDRRRFGRVSLRLPPSRLAASLLRQARALARIAAREGVRLDHLKPHGALYHDASRDPALARIVARAVRSLGPGVAWLGEPGGWQERTARRLGLPFLREGFADRRYAPDGRLVPRGMPGAILRDPRLAGAQARRLVRRGRVDALCVHSDTPGGVAIARAVRRAIGPRR